MMQLQTPASESKMNQSDAIESRRSSRIRIPVWIPVTVALLAGGLGGAAVESRRVHAGEALVSVGSTVIKRTDLYNRLQSYAGVPMMHKMVEEELQIQFAKAQGVSPTDAEVEAKYTKLSNTPGFMSKLVASGETVNDFKHGLRVNLAQQGVITQNVTVSDAEVQRYYQQNSDPRNTRAQFYTPETIGLRAIVTATRDQSMKALQALNNNTDFPMVAQTFNRDQTRKSGGLLPPIQRGRTKLSQSPALENALFALPVGKQMGPVQVGNAWWIVRCEEKAPAKTVPFAAAHDDCVDGAKLVKGMSLNAANIQKKFQEFESATNLQAFASRYQAAIQKD